MMATTEDFISQMCQVNGTKYVKRGRPGIYPYPGREGINSLTIEDVPGFDDYPWLLSLGGFRTRHDSARDPFPYHPYYYQMRWIVVDQKGKRFMNGYPPAPQDTPHRCLSYFDPDLPGYPRIPCLLIFDEAARVEGPIAPPGLKEVAYE